MLAVVHRKFEEYYWMNRLERWYDKYDANLNLKNRRPTKNHHFTSRSVGFFDKGKEKNALHKMSIHKMQSKIHCMLICGKI